jgi:hypothetical protein
VIRCWDAGEGKEIRKWKYLDPERKDNLQYLMSFHLTADGKRLLTCSPIPDDQADLTGVCAAGTFTIWDAASGDRLERRTIPTPSHSDVFSPDGRRRAAEGGKVYDDAGRVRLTLRSEQGVGTPFGDAFAFSPNGALVAGVLWETITDGPRHTTVAKGIQVWELATGAPILRLPVKKFGRFAFSPDGRRLAMVDKESIHLWDIADGREVFHQTAPPRLFGPYGSPFAFAPDGRSLATGLEDTSIVIWDLAPADVPAAPAAVPLTAEDRDGLWVDLAGADAIKAHQAAQRLIARPAEAVPQLRDRLRPAPAVPAEKLQRLIADLDADDLDVREAASRQLSNLRRQLEPTLRDALAKKPTAEQRRRMEAVLDEPDVLPPGDALRGVRAALALERIGTAGAREVLEKLASGDADAPPTQEARDVLKRLDAHK